MQIIKRKNSQPTLLGGILDKYQVKESESKRPVNVNWEEAQEFLKYIGVEKNKRNTIQMLGFFKRRGKEKVLAQKSFFADAKFDRKRFFGFLNWRMDELKKLELEEEK